MTIEQLEKEIITLLEESNRESYSKGYHDAVEHMKKYIVRPEKSVEKTKIN